MTDSVQRPVRIDAIHNVDRLVRAALEVFREVGPHATLESVASRAGLGARTLYRHFPSRDSLLQAVLNLAIAQRLAPAIDSALGQSDPLQGLADLLSSTLAMVASERQIVAAANDARVITDGVVKPVLDAVAVLTGLAQQAGAVRADLDAHDIHQLLGCLAGVVWGSAPDDESWRRTLQVVIDGLDPRRAHPLPPSKQPLTATACPAPTPGTAP